ARWPDPVTLALEWIGWQGGALAALPSVHVRPAYRNSGHPKLTQSRKHECHIRLMFVWMPKRRKDHLDVRRADVQLCQGAQCMPRSNLQQRSVGLARNRAQPIREAHRLAQMS